MEKSLPRNGARGRRALWLPIVVALIASMLGVAVVGAAPTSAATCGCRNTGPYTTPARKAFVRGETSPGGGAYRLVVSQTATAATLEIKRASNGETVHIFHDVPLGRIQYGFSPDGNRFLVSHQDQDTPRDEVVLYDLVGNKQVFIGTVNSGQNMSFSPHGRWFMVNSLSGTTTSELVIVDAGSGATALSTSIAFDTIPGDPGDKFGIINGGFSSDAADTAFAYAFRQRNGGSILLNLRNLSTRRDTMSMPVGDAFWKFSPCGDVLGLVNQTAEHLNTAQVSLHSTAQNDQVGPTQFFAPIPAEVDFDSTIDFHRAVTTGFDGTVKYTNMAPNGASEGCTTAPAVDSVSVDPTSVVGGQRNATGTVRLTSTTPSSLSVTLRSSDTSVATVPSSVTVLSGGQSKTFAVTTRAVTSNKTVTISATAGGVTQSVTLTVTPPPPAPGGGLDRVAIDPARVLAGQPSTGTVTLTEPAGADGVTVALSSNRPDLASVPASVLVPAGATSATFPITTGSNAVIADSPVVITAEQATFVRTARITVMTPDRECMRSSTDVDTEVMKARAFGAYDDANSDVDCAANTGMRRGIVIGAGTTGLPEGAPVRLQLTMRLDGTLASSPPAGGSGGVTTDARMTYTIIDPLLGDSEGGTPELASFTANYTLHHYPLYSGSTENYDWSAHSRFFTNATEPQEHDDSGYSTSEEAVIMAMDTGTYVAEYDTTVGAHLVIDAKLSAVASAYGEGASALADFSNTFRAKSVPAPGFEGLELTYTDGDGPPPTPENRAPQCTDSSLTTAEDTPGSGTVSCTDADGDALTYTVVDGPAHGTLTGPGSDGSFTYTPAANHHGADSFTVKANDGAAESAIATINIDVTEVNDAPTCTGGNGATQAGTPLNGTVSCTDVDGDALTFVVSTEATHGTVSAIAADGTFTYTPAAGYSGADSFAFSASDGRGGAANGQFSVEVTAAPIPALRPGLVLGAGTIAVPGSSDRITIAPEALFTGRNAIGVVAIQRTGKSAMSLAGVNITDGGTWRSGTARFGRIVGNATLQQGKGAREKVTFGITVADDRTDTVWITVRRQDGSLVRELSTGGLAPSGGQPLTSGLNSVTVLYPSHHTAPVERGRSVRVRPARCAPARVCPAAHPGRRAP
jgi:VCBS repeat-containing protein